MVFPEAFVPTYPMWVWHVPAGETKVLRALYAEAGLDEPIIFESVVAYLQYQGKKLQSISFRPVLMNKIGKGEADVHNGHTNNQFLDTRGLPTPATGERARYILERLAASSVDGHRPTLDAINPGGAAQEVRATDQDLACPGL